MRKTVLGFFVIALIFSLCVKSAHAFQIDQKKIKEELETSDDNFEYGIIFMWLRPDFTVSDRPPNVFADLLRYDGMYNHVPRFFALMWLDILNRRLKRILPDTFLSHGAFRPNLNIWLDEPESLSAEKLIKVLDIRLRFLQYKALSAGLRPSFNGQKLADVFDGNIRDLYKIISPDAYAEYKKNRFKVRLDFDPVIKSAGIKFSSNLPTFKFDVGFKVKNIFDNPEDYQFKIGLRSVKLVQKPGLDIRAGILGTYKFGGGKDNDFNLLLGIVGRF